MTLTQSQLAKETNIYYYQDILTPADAQKYIVYPIFIPNGSSRIIITLFYNHSNRCNLLGFQVFDPNGFRARGQNFNQHGQKGVGAVIENNRITQSVVPGEIVSGLWTIEINTWAIESLCPFSLQIEIDSDETARNSLPKKSTSKNFLAIPKPLDSISSSHTKSCFNKGARWYRGDLHAHSTESDGRLSVLNLINLADKKNLDFLAITDHNIHTGWLHFTGCSCLPLKGIELTTYQGHANAIGITDWVDWRTGLNGYEINDVIQRVHQQGGIFSINHPCTGNLPDDHAAWKYENVDYNLVDAIEVWNAATLCSGSRANQESRQFWDKLLNRGYRITGIGGSDWHCQANLDQSIGVPMTYILADSLSESSILEGIRKGHAFITLGPEIKFTVASRTGDLAIVGEELKLASPQDQIWLNASLNQAPPGTQLKLIKNGEIVRTETIFQPGLFSISWLEEVWPAEFLGEKAWYRLELHNPQLQKGSGGDTLLALTNPIYISRS